MKSLHTQDIDAHFSTEEPQELPTILKAQRSATRRRLLARPLQIESLEERRLMTADFSDMTIEEQQATSAIVATAPSQNITNQIEQSRLLSTAALDQFFANLATELPVEHTVDTWLDTPDGQVWLSTLTQAALAHPVTLESITDIIAQAQSKRVPLTVETPSQTLQADFLLQQQLAERALTAIPVTTENTALRTDIEKLTIPYNRSKAHHIGNGQFIFTLESTTKQVTVYVTSEYRYSVNGVQSRGTKVFHLDRQQMRSSHELSAYFSGNMVRFLIVDSQDPSKKIDEIQIPFTGYAQPEAVWPEMQSGLLLEKPITPSIWIQEIRGRNVTVVYQTPYNAGSIGIPGHYMGFETVKTQHEGGTLPTATVLTFTNLEPRTNTIELRDHKGGVIATVPLQVTATYPGGIYTPTYSVQPEHTWNADTYTAQLDTWLPHSKATDTAQIYQEELRREQAFVYTVDAKFYPVDWGILYQRMYSAKAGNQRGVLTKWIGPHTHTLAPFYISNIDYLRKQKASRPDLFAPNGSVLPGKWNAAVMFEQNTNQYYVQYLTKIEGFMNMAAEVLADLSNGGSMYSPSWQAYRQYYPMGFTDIQGGYHTQDSMLQTVASILQSNQAKPMIDAWQKEADTLHRIQDTKRAQEAERALYRNERIMGDLIARGFARNTVTTTEHTQNQARAIETFSSSQASAKAKELATSRNYQRAQRLIAQRLESTLPPTGRLKIVANYTYNSPIIVQDTETQSTVFTIRTEEVAEVAGVMMRIENTIEDAVDAVERISSPAEKAAFELANSNQWEWYKENISIPTYDNYFVNTSTSAGRVAAGTLQKLWMTKNSPDLRVFIATKASIVFGISAEQFLSASTTNVASFSRHIGTLLASHGYGHLFSRSGQFETLQNSVKATSDKAQYVGGTIRVSFDNYSAIGQVQNVSARLRNANGIVLNNVVPSRTGEHAFSFDVQSFAQDEALNFTAEVVLQVKKSNGTIVEHVAATQLFSVEKGNSNVLNDINWHTDLTDLIDLNGSRLDKTPYIANDSLPDYQLTSPEISNLYFDAVKNEITLQWSNIGHTGRYKIYVFSSENTEGVDTFVNSSQSTITLGGFRPGNTYFFGLRAEDQNGRLYNSVYKQGGYDGLKPLYIDDLNSDKDFDFSVQTNGQRGLTSQIHLTSPNRVIHSAIVPRFIKNKYLITETMSNHSSGKAVDIFFDNNAIDIEKGNLLFNRLIEYANKLGIYELMWQNKYWSLKTGIIYKEGHEDHIHVSLDNNGALRMDFSELYLADIL